MQHTSEFPQLPQGSGTAPPLVPPGHIAYPVGVPMPAQAVPAVPPSPGRSPGFWVAVTAAITIGVVLALLGGFFIGRGSRLSNAEVQNRLTQQQQADLIVQQKTLNDQRTDLLRRQRTLIGRVSSKAEARGRREGVARGRQKGFADGQSQGIAQGQAQGYQEGRDTGFDQGLCLADYFYC